jgi:hypothetical protein
VRQFALNPEHYKLFLKFGTSLYQGIARRSLPAEGGQARLRNRVFGLKNAEKRLKTA